MVVVSKEGKKYFLKYLPLLHFCDNDFWEELSKVRQQISSLNKRRTELLGSIIKTESFIAAQVYEHFKKCGNKNCKCARGELHGPFTWFYRNKKGQKLISTSIKKDVTLLIDVANWTNLSETLSMLPPAPFY